MTLPRHSEQLLALFALLDKLKAEAESTERQVGDAEGNNAKGGVEGKGRAAFKGIVFVEQVALTYPLAHLINQHFSKSSSQGSNINGDSQCATCFKPRAAEFEEPTALPVSGTGSMVDADRYTTLYLASLDSSTLVRSSHSFIGFTVIIHRPYRTT